jgi:hypothetical protein
MCNLVEHKNSFMQAPTLDKSSLATVNDPMGNQG